MTWITQRVVMAATVLCLHVHGQFGFGRNVDINAMQYQPMAPTHARPPYQPIAPTHGRPEHQPMAPTHAYAGPQQPPTHPPTRVKPAAPTHAYSAVQQGGQGHHHEYHEYQGHSHHNYGHEGHRNVIHSQHAKQYNQYDNNVESIKPWDQKQQIKESTPGRCYRCTGMYPEKECVYVPQYANNKAANVSCNLPYCTTWLRYTPDDKLLHEVLVKGVRKTVPTKILKVNDFKIKSIARECDSFPRGNSCELDGDGLGITCTTTCTTRLCNKDTRAPSRHILDGREIKPLDNWITYTTTAKNPSGNQNGLAIIDNLVLSDDGHYDNHITNKPPRMGNPPRSTEASVITDEIEESSLAHLLLGNSAHNKSPSSLLLSISVLLSVKLCLTVCRSN